MNFTKLFFNSLGAFWSIIGTLVIVADMVTGKDLGWQIPIILGAIFWVGASILNRLDEVDITITPTPKQGETQ